MRKGNRVLAIAMAVVLTIGLWPGAAVADMRSTDADSLAAGGVQAQATTRIVNGVTLEQNSGVWTITGYSGSASSLNLNSLGVGVITKIGDGAFKGCTKLKSVTLPSMLQEVGGSAFEGCSYLTSVSLPSSVTSIGNYAFKDCSSLKSLKIPQNVSANNLGWNAYINLGLNSKITATTGDQYKKLKKNSDYITITRTTAVLASNSLYRAKVSSISNKSWSGKKIAPSPVVKMGSKKLKKGTDYTLSYKNNKNLGVATVTIKGKGSYVGAKTATFKIVPAKVTGVEAKSPYSGCLIVSWSNKAAERAGASGYRIYWKAAGRKKAAYGDVSSIRCSSARVYGLPKGKVTVKVQAYTHIGGKKVYGPWSASKIAKVKE